MRLLCDVSAAFGAVRSAMRAMGAACSVPIEPAEQSELLTATERLPGVVASGVPGGA